jgi:hypothetical protein
MKLTTTFVTAIVLTMGAVLPATSAGRSLPVMITADKDSDACGTGRVGGLNPRGDGFLAVKAGPGLNFDRIDKLGNGTEVYLCGYYGDWVAIVYSATGRRTGCGLEEPWLGGPRSRPYTGPCLSGWVHRNWIVDMAG